MRYGVIDATARTAKIGGYKDIWEAGKTVGIKMGEVDFGAVSHSTSVVVYEYGLFVDPAEQKYFSINGQLFAGNAVVFDTNDQGEDIDMIRLPDITWYQNADAVEKAIQRGYIKRPEMRVNDKLLWSWPQKHEIPTRQNV